MAILQGAVHGERAWVASFRGDAKPLQLDLSRRRARDDSAVHRPGRRIDSVEPAGAGFFAGNRKPDSSEATARAKTDEFAQRFYFQENDFEIAEAASKVARQYGVSPTQIALRVDSSGARCDRADYWRD